MHPSEAYFRSELATLVQPVEQVFNALIQALAAYVPTLLAALFVVLFFIGVAYLSSVLVRLNSMGTGATVGELVITEAGSLAVRRRADEKRRMVPLASKIDPLPSEPATCN